MNGRNIPVARGIMPYLAIGHDRQNENTKAWMLFDFDVLPRVFFIRSQEARMGVRRVTYNGKIEPGTYCLAEFRAMTSPKGRFYIRGPTHKLWTAEMFDSVFTNIPVHADPATVTARVDLWQIFKNGRLA